MEKNEVFTFTSDGKESVGIVLNYVSSISEYSYSSEFYVCYTPNKLLLWEEGETWREDDEINKNYFKRVKSILWEDICIPELDSLILEYKRKHWKYIKVEYFKNGNATCEDCEVEPMGRKECLNAEHIMARCFHKHYDYAVVWEDIPYEDKEKELIDKYAPNKTYPEEKLETLTNMIDKEIAKAETDSGM